ncbi:hypothetical protein T265_02945, partial [Opisthorchis viverrini]
CVVLSKSYHLVHFSGAVVLGSRKGLYMNEYWIFGFQGVHRHLHLPRPPRVPVKILQIPLRLRIQSQKAWKSQRKP